MSAHHHHHDHDHDHGPGHNHAHDHLHSHVHGQGERDKAEALQVLAASFVDGFRKAEDKTSYLRLAGIPFQREGRDGCTLHLVDARIEACWQLGSASPGFASRELVYMPFPGEMVKERETMTFTYVSMRERLDENLLTILHARDL